MYLSLGIPRNLGIMEVIQQDPVVLDWVLHETFENISRGQYIRASLSLLNLTRIQLQNWALQNLEVTGWTSTLLAPTETEKTQDSGSSSLKAIFG